MPRLRKVSLTLCVCAVVLALGAATAAATVERLLISESPFTMTSSGGVSFRNEIFTIRCNLTMQGSFNSATSPTIGASLGSVNSATASGCEGFETPTVTFLSFPWSLTYSSFRGTQPEGMTAVLSQLNGVSLQFRTALATCLYRGTVGLSLALSGTNPYPIGTISTLTNSFSLVSGSGCPSSGSMNGSFRLSAERWLAEQDPLPLRAEEDWLRASAAQTEKTVTFTNTERNNVIAEIANIVGSGWSSNNGGCTFAPFIAPRGTCQIRLRASGAATAGRYELWREAPMGVPTGRRGVVYLLPN